MSKLDEILATRSPSLVCTIRCDIRSAASLALFCRKEGEQVRSRGEMLRLAIEWFAALVVTQNPELEIKTATKAEKILKLLNMDSQKRPKSLLTQLQEEAIVGGGIEPEAFVDEETVLDPDFIKQVAKQAEDFNSTLVRRRMEEEASKKQMKNLDDLPIAEED